ncbi:MAG TPA: helix-turn-helix transcriptional regulator [Solirubrobacteraceae bacterium]|nr:helix-turn-helix transcriptional regulator [Solirubrobacteraceae bacterium]
MALQNQEIGRRIAELRKAKGSPPQTLVAAALGVGERTYQTWESGEAKPSYRSLQLLAAYYGVGEDYILTGNVAPPATPDPSNGSSSEAVEVRARLERIEAMVAELISNARREGRDDEEQAG